MPRIVPVIDVLDGRVVRAVAGRRSEYGPIVSRVTDSTEPLQVAKDLLAATGASELYVADLDAIQGRAKFGKSPGVAGAEALRSPGVRQTGASKTPPRPPRGFTNSNLALSDSVRVLLDAIDIPVWLDCGIKNGNDLSRLEKWPRVRPIVGFESAPTPDPLSNDATFSLDLLDGELFGPWQSWGVASSRDGMGVVEIAVAKGIRSLIVLDLAAVGVGEGPRTLDLCHRIRKRFPQLELLAGGGVRNASDLARFGEVGVDGVLIASAIHDGHFTIDTSA